VERSNVIICVIGLGYVGLPTAALLAERGYNVIGVDISAQKVSMVNRGLSYLNEPGLNEILSHAVYNGRLRATIDVEEALGICGAVLIDVPTPVKNGVADLSQVVNVSKAIARKLRRNILLLSLQCLRVLLVV